MHSHRRIVLLLLLLLATPSFAAETLRRLGEDETWSGSVRLQSSVTVPVGVRLTLAAGTRVEFAPGAQVLVEGTLQAEGTAEAPVVLRGAGKDGAALVDAGTPGALVVLSHTQLQDAGTGVSLRGTQLSARDCTFTGCATAVSLEIRSRGKLERIQFRDNDLGLSVNNSSSCDGKQLIFAENRVGMGVSNSSRLRLEGAIFDKNEVGYGQQNACDVELRDCTFQDNQIGARLRQTRRSPAISRATFRDNTTGIAARLFSHVLVEGSTFTGNRTAFDALNFCGAFLRYNDFTGNGQAIRLDKKSNSRVQGNRIRENKIGLYADYSSYPRVEGNLFAANDWHVRLGIYQSADWERRQGSRGLMMKAAKEANSRNPMMLSGDIPAGSGVFSVAGNAWDAATTAELGGGEGINVSRFWDGRDQEPVRYEGFGEGTYPVDVIHFSPPLSGEGLAVGPDAWIPLESPPPPEPPNPPAGTGPGTRAGQLPAAGVTRPGQPPPPAPDAAPRDRP